MTPLDLLRRLFGYDKTVDDYQMVTLIFEEAIRDRVYREFKEREKQNE